jgi:glucose-6-phosphate 1-epimerase
MASGWRTVVRNGLDVVELETAASTAAIALQGAQVLSFVPRGGADRLWVSERARWAAGVALRGGIPLCFPWFGPHPTERGFPAHGFARTRVWRLANVAELDDGRVRATLALDADGATKALFPYPFEARLMVTVGDELSLAFEVTNPGAVGFDYELALHSYFAVPDVAAIAIEGLSGSEFVDKVAGGARRREGEAPVRIAGEVDRIYDSGGPVTLVEPSGARLRIESAGAGSTVVWNPAPAKTATLGDMAPEGYRRFVCIETGALGDRRITLAPGARHALTVRYT